MKFPSFIYKYYFSWYVKQHSQQIKKLLSPTNIDPRRILVISNTALGDTLLSTPAIESIKLSFPSVQLAVLIHKNILPLFDGHPSIDMTIPFNGGFRHFFATLKKIRQFNPDTVLILHGNSPQDIYFSVMSGAKYVLKHPTHSSLKHFLSYDFPKKEQHTIEDRLDLVRYIGGNKTTTKMSLPPLADERLTAKYRSYEGMIGFQIGAADRYKMWPIEYFIELAQKILKDDPSIQIVITGVEKEWELADQIVKTCGVRVHNLCGKSTISELPYLIKSLKMLITNDTGTMHLAIALKVPTLSLFSPTSSDGIGPYQDKEIHKVIQKDGSYIQELPKKKRDNSAMKLISVDEVYDIFQQVVK